jgi:hypothetical protein
MTTSVRIGVISLCLLAVVGAAIFGCNRRAEVRNSCGSPTVVPVGQLVSDPQKYAHKLVTVCGCYLNSFENSTLRPCEQGLQSEQEIWVEDAAVVESFRKFGDAVLKDNLVPPLQTRSFWTYARPQFVFSYDEGRNRRAWQQLVPSSAANSMFSEVVIVGQFETTSPREGFGHLSAYGHELILVDVIETKTLHF